jgi:hypothetical protein
VTSSSPRTAIGAATPRIDVRRLHHLAMGRSVGTAFALASSLSSCGISQWCFSGKQNSSWTPPRRSPPSTAITCYPTSLTCFCPNHVARQVRLASLVLDVKISSCVGHWRATGRGRHHVGCGHGDNPGAR